VFQPAPYRNDGDARRPHVFFVDLCVHGERQSVKMRVYIRLCAISGIPLHSLHFTPLHSPLARGRRQRTRTESSLCRRASSPPPLQSVVAFADGPHRPETGESRGTRGLVADDTFTTCELDGMRERGSRQDQRGSRHVQRGLLGDLR